ncbi:MAG TPA: methyl-accepting chemotaxis protein [Nannocystaceae bacterium]|nr:methyl-accepting chemotaxis protein [Nannocystaceae bacterium]
MADLAIDESLLEGVWQTVSRRVLERAGAAVELLEALVHAQGRVVRRDQELWAGHTVLNYDRELLPRVSRASSLGMSVYLGNRRIATYTSLDAGPAPEVGAYAEAILVDHVLRKRQAFRGTIECQGRPSIVAARPLFSTDKPEEYGPIGMIESYQDVATLREMLASSWQQNAADDPIAMQRQMHADRLAAVVAFVDDVARRLQLLALNGNIIAAQAGDHGRAFRVVCRELGSLAEQSKDAVAEVRRIGEDLRPRTPDGAPTAAEADA